jgi:hypothetical protein
MPKYRDPGADKRMQEFESSLRGVMQEKPKKAKEPSACGQGSCSSKYIRDYK